MAAITFFFNPMSRAQIVRWALHEVGADYDAVFVDWGHKPKALLDANPMGKLPTIIHHDGGHDRVVTEAAAICHYLAAVYTSSNLSPQDHEKADYFRWMFFAAGPLEQAATAKMLGWQVPANREASAGFGTYDLTVDTLEHWFDSHDYVCGDRFTMADVYVGMSVDWGLKFGFLPDRPSFLAYAERFRARPAYREAKAIDDALIAQAQSEG
ncbi:glutathione S-transferase family protein [Tsuneonella sp. HG222]